MAVYTGLTYFDIIKMAEFQAKISGIPADINVIEKYFDESAMEVAIDLADSDLVKEIVYPNNNQVNLETENILYPSEVYGKTSDGELKPFYKTDFERYTDWITNGNKSPGDDNLYYTIYGGILYLEPASDLTFTNLLLKYTTRISKYEEANKNNEPEIAPEFRELIVYKILYNISPVQFKSYFLAIYKTKLKDKKRLLNKLQSQGTVRWWNNLDIDLETR
jgi:hypothetical protein